MGSYLVVSYNETLAECTAGLYDLITNDGVGGAIDFLNNAPGCNSVCEVLGECEVSNEDATAPLVTGLSPLYPNPTTGAATLAYTLETPGEVTLAVYDALGRRVTTLVEGPRSAGEHEVTLGAELPTGMYVVRFETDGEAWTERVTVVR